MRSYLTIILLTVLIVAGSHLKAADWDPFTNREQMPSGIPIPSSSRTLDEQKNDWPQASASSTQWKENKDSYEVTMPLRLPEDADSGLMSTRYSDGSIKIFIPKNKVKWDVLKGDHIGGHEIGH